MSEPRPLLRLRLKFAAVGLFGAALVALPLSQVLRYQSAELQTLLSERQALDPLTNAVAVQRNLISHRDATDHVLRGRSQLEPERRLRQGSVDESLWTLQGTLSAGQWLLALTESGAMLQDWRTLVQRIGARQIDPAGNQTQHQLLLEQAIQVMDFVSASAEPGSWAQLAGLLATHPAGAVVAPGSIAPGALAEASMPFMARRVVSLDRALIARMAVLDARTADLQAQRTTLLCTAGALLALASCLTLWAWPKQPALPGPPGDDTRRSRGRRASDMDQHAPESSRLVERLRAATSPQKVEHPKVWPPRRG